MYSFPMPTLLITQCLQRDFVDPIGPHDPLPNHLHVGHAEARRLLGEIPEEGPVATLLAWARSQPDLHLLHVRDWHDPQDPAQAEHLTHFQPHCLRGTRGARLVLDFDDHPAPNEHLVDALTLNDFEGSSLPAHLERIRALSPGEPLRVGVMGVWTDVKVSFLLYDLKTRARVDALATCSALTASHSRSQHFLALDQLRRVLGVEVLDAVSAFAAWLRPGSALTLPGARPRWKVPVEGVSLDETDQDLVTHLFRDARSVELTPLGGGFSGARVYRARSTDAFGHRQAPTVVKLGKPHLIGHEREAFERVEGVLGNHAPTLRGAVDLGDRAGLRFSFAGIGPSVRTFKALYERGAPQEVVDRVLRETIVEVLGPLYAASRYERLPLLAHYEFRRYAHGVRARVASVVGPEAAAADRIQGRPNVADFYERFLPTVPDVPGECHPVSWAHGDLNGANILLDDRENVWVIDFTHTGPGHHVLKDLAKLENDLLYIMTPIADDGELEQGVGLVDALRAVSDLRAPLPESPPEGVQAPALVRAWATLRTLRALGADLCQEDRSPIQMDVALLRYAVHTMGFDESSPLQRRWALLSACGLASDLETTLSANRRLRVDWIPALPALGMTLCPGRRDRGRDLAQDVSRLVEEGVAELVCLVTDQELEAVGVPDLGAAVKARGLRFHRLPIPDQGVPTLDEARALVGRILDATGAGEKVVLHCMGGLGRTGTLAACALVARGFTPEGAIAHIRGCREARMVENRAQEAFVGGYR